MKGGIEAVVFTAGRVDARGTVFLAEDLRALADDQSLFWDEDRQALVYRGPPPVPESG